MIGDSISVTVVAIKSEITTLFVRYRDETQRVEQKLALEVDDRLEITNEIHVYVLDIRDDKVRLGVVAPKVFAVHRKEVYEAIQKEAASLAHIQAATIETYSIGRAHTLHVGENLQLSLLPSEDQAVQLSATGQWLGGPRDGEPFIRCESISIGSTFDFGTLVRVCVESITEERVGLKIDHPTHMMCRIEE